MSSTAFDEVLTGYDGLQAGQEAFRAARFTDRQAYLAAEKEGHPEDLPTNH